MFYHWTIPQLILLTLKCLCLGRDSVSDPNWLWTCHLRTSTHEWLEWQAGPTRPNFLCFFQLVLLFLHLRGNWILFFFCLLVPSFQSWFFPTSQSHSNLTLFLFCLLIHWELHTLYFEHIRPPSQSSPSSTPFTTHKTCCPFCLFVWFCWFSIHQIQLVLPIDSWPSGHLQEQVRPTKATPLKTSKFPFSGLYWLPVAPRLISLDIMSASLVQAGIPSGWNHTGLEHAVTAAVHSYDVSWKPCFLAIGWLWSESWEQCCDISLRTKHFSLLQFLCLCLGLLLFVCWYVLLVCFW